MILETNSGMVNVTEVEKTRVLGKTKKRFVPVWAIVLITIFTFPFGLLLILWKETAYSVQLKMLDGSETIVELDKEAYSDLNNMLASSKSW